MRLIKWLRGLHFHKWEVLDVIEDSIYKKCKVCGKVIREYSDMTGMDIFTSISSEQQCINHRKLINNIKLESERLKLINTLNLKIKQNL